MPSAKEAGASASQNWRGRLLAVVLGAATLIGGVAAVVQLAGGSDDLAATERVLWSIDAVEPGTTGAEAGACFNASRFSDRSDARACRVGPLIHDPCFLDADRAACPVDPLADQVVWVDVSADRVEHPGDYEGSPIDDDAITAEARSLLHLPWFVLLEDGTKCSRASVLPSELTSSASRAGRDIEYLCSVEGGDTSFEVVFEPPGSPEEQYLWFQWTPTGLERAAKPPAGVAFDLLQDGPVWKLGLDFGGGVDVLDIAVAYQ